MNIRTLLILSSVWVGAGCGHEALSVVEQPQALGACQFDAPAVAGGGKSVLVTVADGAVLAIGADGAPRTLFRLGEGLVGATLDIPQVSARGELVAASALWTLGDPPSRWRREVVLVDRDGEVRWHALRDGGGEASLLLGDGGHLAVRTDNGGLFVRPDGSSEELPGMYPIERPAPDGSVVFVQRFSSETSLQYGWWSSVTRSFAAVQHRPRFGAAGPRWVGDRVVYLTFDDGRPALVAERPGEARLVELPAEERREELVIKHIASPGGWILLGTYDNEGASWRVHMPDGAVDRVTLEVPSGLQRFSIAQLTEPRIGDDGSILLGLRDQSAGGLYRSVDRGATWQRVGHRVADIRDVTGVVQGGTTLVYGTNRRFSEEKWQPAPAGQEPELTGDTLQLVRLDGTVAASSRTPLGLDDETPTRDATLSDDGACHAAWIAVQSEGQLTPTSARLDVVRVSDGHRFTVLQADLPDGRTDVVAAPAWWNR